MRPYQSEALAAVHNFMCTREENPCVVLPTGSGKVAQHLKKTNEKFQKDLARFRDLAGNLVSKILGCDSLVPVVYRTKDGKTICSKCARDIEQQDCINLDEFLSWIKIFPSHQARDLYPASVLDGGGIFYSGTSFECQASGCINLLRPVEELCP